MTPALRSKPSRAFIARTRVPDTVPGPRMVQRAERVPGSIDLADLERLNARTYRVDYKRDLRPGIGFHWHVWISGPGHWCEGSNGEGSNGKGGPGLGGSFRTEAEAIAVGELWVKTGRTR